MKSYSQDKKRGKKPEPKIKLLKREGLRDHLEVSVSFYDEEEEAWETLEVWAAVAFKEQYSHRLITKERYKENPDGMTIQLLVPPELPDELKNEVAKVVFSDWLGMPGKQRRRKTENNSNRKNADERRGPEVD